MSPTAAAVSTAANSVATGFRLGLRLGPGLGLGLGSDSDLDLDLDFQTLASRMRMMKMKMDQIHQQPYRQALHRNTSKYIETKPFRNWRLTGR